MGTDVWFFDLLVFLTSNGVKGPGNRLKMFPPDGLPRRFEQSNVLLLPVCSSLEGSDEAGEVRRVEDEHCGETRVRKGSIEKLLIELPCKGVCFGDLQLFLGVLSVHERLFDVIWGFELLLLLTTNRR